jgi:hypothetical protein
MRPGGVQLDWFEKYINSAKNGRKFTTSTSEPITQRFKLSETRVGLARLYPIHPNILSNTRARYPMTTTV